MSNEKQRPKCVVGSFYCDGGSKDCPFYQHTNATWGKCLHHVYNTSLCSCKDAHKAALRAALEELTDMRWVMIDKPKG